MTIPDWMIDESSIPKSEALETLARELPNYWNVQITVENGGYDVTLFDPNDYMIELSNGDGIEAALLEALRFAKWRESNVEIAIGKAWARFRAAVKTI